MEDASVVIDGYGGDAGSGYFGVYDGHGGRNVADYLRLHLHVAVEKELQVKGDRSVEECLKAAFLITDMECSATGEQASGSTAAVCVIRRQGPKRYIYTANCGDARAVLCHAGAAVRLSKDHKATDALERARIEAAGGFVIRKRVMGVLAVARSFGDYVLKKFVTTEPYTSTTKIDGMSQFVIIACDGVWDVLEDQEAVDLIKTHVGLTATTPAASYASSSSASSAGSAASPSSSPPAGSGAGAVGGSGAAPGGSSGSLSSGGISGGASSLAADAFASSARVKSAAQVLVDAALSRGSSDNITALVVFL